MTYYITCQMNVYIAASQQAVFLNAGEYCVLDIDAGERLVLNITPLENMDGEYLLPYAVDLNNIKSHPHIEKVDILGHTILVLKAKKIYASKTERKVLFAQKNLTIGQESANDKIYIKEDDEVLFEAEIDVALTDMVVSVEKASANSYLSIQGLGKRGKYFFLAKDVREPIVSKVVDDCVITDKQITLIKYLADHCGHVLINVLTLNDDGWTVSEGYTAYAGLPPNLPSCRELVPCVFADCVRAGNYTLATEMMSESLGKVLSMEKIKAFLGEYDSITEHDGLVVLNKRYTPVGVYRMIMRDGKIDNIIPLWQST